jgi:8-oxo-dGTP pyrophosphatase MutT (NUDIX family)
MKALPRGTFDDSPKAAVSLILRPDDKERLAILLIKRNSRSDDPWSGQMAFPGGRFKKGDANLLATAKREAKEETGIEIGDTEIVGELNEIVSGSFVIRVSPFVVFSERLLEVKIDPSEISDFFWIPEGYFRDANNISPYLFERAGQKIQFPSYRYRDHVIWGMTFKIIQDFVSKTGNINSA